MRKSITAQIRFGIPYNEAMIWIATVLIHRDYTLYLQILVALTSKGIGPAIIEKLK